MAKRKTQKIEIEEGQEFTICPQCGYADGFHNVFEGLNASKPAKWLLICPMCSSKYDIGLKYDTHKQNN